MTPSTATKLETIIQEALDADTEASSMTVETKSVGGGKAVFTITVNDKEAADILGEDENDEEDEDSEDEELEDVETGEEG